MSEKPITFNTEMVKAILTCKECGKISVPFPCGHCGGEDFLKTVTRRVIKLPESPRKEVYWQFDGILSDGEYAFVLTNGQVNCNFHFLKPKYKKGDILWMKETFNDYDGTYYRNPVYRATDENFKGQKWKSSRFMPKSAARIWLEVTEDVRPERLHEITYEDCIKEGWPRYKELYPTINTQSKAKKWFINLWDSLNAKRGYPWESNHCVLRVEFKRKLWA